MKNNIEIITIIWEDAAIFGSNTQHREDIEKYNLMHGISAGILIKEDKKKVIIGMDYWPEHQTFRTVQVYPKSGIQQIIRKKLDFLPSNPKPQNDN